MNLRWLPEQGLVDEADHAPWNMRGAWALRRLNYATQARTSFAGALMFALGSIAALIVVPEVHHGQAALIIAAAGGLFVAITLIVLVMTLDPQRLMRAVPVTALPVLPSAGILISLALAATGNTTEVFAILYVESPLLGFYMYRRRPAMALVGLIAIEYAGVLAWRGVPFGQAFAEWFVVSSTVAVTGMLIGSWAARAEQLSESEHAVRTELATLNATLEERVSSQVDELERVGRMRRFLSPQIAKVVESEGDEELLRPHRRRVAVLFCDLRGFTAFTNRAEPEEVIEVLDEYYRAAGEVLRRRDATIGGYAGDGIMAYFGDPVPRETPALDAAAAALEVALVLDELSREWIHRGHDLGYGMGLALGYATLGTVGFDGRYDYTPLGTVVNLAARLCARASHGQVLIDHATQLECELNIPATAVDGVSLKGFGADIKVFSIS